MEIWVMQARLPYSGYISREKILCEVFVFLARLLVYVLEMV